MTVCVRCVLLSGLVGLLIHQLQQLVHVHTVNGAGLLHSLATGRGATQAVHTDGEEDGSGLRGNIQNITDDGVLFDFDQVSKPPFDIYIVSISHVSVFFNRKIMNSL